ncbi:MAG: hypothetical protein IK140_03100, partial [Clostridia bacterium]|nr:hypothetical protein [Clostridia bacterium]
MKKIAIALCLIAALAAGYFIFRSNKAPSLSASYSNGVLYYSVANLEGSAPLMLSDYGDLGKTVSGTKSGAIYIELKNGDYVLSASNDRGSISAGFSVPDTAQTDAKETDAPAPQTAGPTAAPEYTIAPSPAPTQTPDVAETPEPTQAPSVLVLTADYDHGILTYTLENVSGPLEIRIDSQSARRTVTDDGSYSVDIDLRHGIHTVEALSAGNTAKAQVMAHEYEILPATEPTCTQDGLTEGEVCRVCGDVLRQQQPIPAIGHDTEIREALEPTCTEDGYSREEVCRRCGEVLVAG